MAPRKRPREEESASEGDPETRSTQTITAEDIQQILAELRATREQLQDTQEQLLTATNRLDALEGIRARSHTPPDDESVRALPPGSPPPLQPPVAAQPDPSRDPRPPKTSVFTGKVSEFRNFLAQCSLTFALCPNTYAKDEQKVLFVIGNLRGTPLTWAREVAINKAHPLRNDYNSFEAALSSLYLDRNLKAICEDKLVNLRQTKSVASYSVEFESIIGPLELRDNAKCIFFHLGLKSGIKKSIAIVGRAEKYAELKDQAIAIDQRKHQLLLEEQRPTLAPTSVSGNRLSPSSRQDSNSIRPTAPQFKSSSSNSRPQPAKPFSSSSSGFRKQPSQPFVPRGPLTEEEKQFREKHNLCRYCADPKHTTDNCPEIARKNNNKVNAIQISPSPSPPLSPDGSENFDPQAPARSEA